MDDYISRQAAIDALGMAIDVDNFRTATGLIHEATVSKVLDCIPAADVAPVVHGEWLPIVSYNNTYKCSECGRLLVDIADGLKMVAKHYPYCHCGAKMDGERKE